MQISAYLPIVLDLLDGNPAIKESVSSRSLQSAYLYVGRVNDAKNQTGDEGYHGISTETLSELEEGAPLSLEAIGKLMHVSNKRVREMLNDLITQIAILHLDSLKQTAE